MFSRRNRNISNQAKDKHILDESLTNESFDLSSSIGNQAMIENLDQIPDFDDYIPVELEPENLLKSREADLFTNRPRLKKEINKTTKDPDVNSVGSEATMIKRYDEESDNEVVLKPPKTTNPPKPKKQEKPKKQQNSAKKKAAKPVVKKRFEDENLITNIKEKPQLIDIPEMNLDPKDSGAIKIEPLKRFDSSRKAERKPMIGMPEKDSDSVAGNSEFILPLIEEIEDKKSIREINSKEDPVMGFFNNIISNIRKENDGESSDAEKESGSEFEDENDNGS